MEVIKLKTAVLDRLTDAEFFEFCQDHRDLRIERDADHQLNIRLPANSETGATKSKLNYQLAH